MSTERHPLRFREGDRYDPAWIASCSCRRFYMGGSQKKGLRAAHAVHMAEKGQAPKWLARLVGLGGDSDGTA
jgi:hypothetical protein